MESYQRIAIAKDPLKFSEYLGYENIDYHKKIYSLLKDPNNKRLLFILPPGFAKSTICTILFPIWEVGNNSNLRCLVASHTRDFVASFIREINSTMNKDEYKQVFGDLKPRKPHKWTQNEIIVDRVATHKDPTFIALGQRESIIGRRIDLAILDDVIDESLATSETLREATLQWFRKELLTRIEPDGRVLIVGNRFDAFDFYGTIIEEEIKLRDKGETPLWKIFILPAINEAGQSNWKERWTLEQLLIIKKVVGSLAFSTLYMCDPTPRGGIKFKSEWLNYWYELETEFTDGKIPNKHHKIPHRQFLQVHMGVDLAISEKEEAAFFAITTIGLDEWGNAFVIDVFRKKLEFPAQCKQVEAHYYAYNPLTINVESTAYQKSLPQHLIKVVGLKNVVPIAPNRKKTLRIESMAPLFENGTIRVHKSQEDLIMEYLRYPHGKYRDCLDSLYYALTPIMDTTTRNPTEPISKILGDMTRGFE